MSALLLPLLLLGSVSLAVPAPAAADDADAADGADGARVVDVMTFNVHHAQGTDAVLDLQRIADVIENSGADVVGLQEVDRHYSARSGWVDQPAALARLLGWHSAYGANLDAPPPAGQTERSQYGTAVLSRYPIVSSENTHLYNADGKEQRGLLRATIDVRGQRLDFYSTHLEHSSQDIRQHQTTEIVDLVDEADPAIVVGDFNAYPDAPEIATLTAAFDDAWEVAGRGDGFTYPAEEPHGRIDNLYVTDRVRPVTAEVVMADPVASDHLPVVSRVVIGPQE
ncbi:endonuclease/exonuclease/phosphatase family protein [Nocardioides albus]|uniref:Endonuclease/exonuclease/phosphatase family metal-dependent hydrolase n=1 Tax=Nocardioides albus TaxID=1841 RepID=A0A7W5A658_9ACTN|nr:endonuclease/exonuclease/phosphatase family protein [Nocardioides albus]MBB3089969.1 endonuclease/exonuclease/phosphatase family metal-dependent hydrolase [Nocardioides albus]